MQPFPKRKVTRPILGDDLADGLVDDLAVPGDGYEEDEEHPERRAHLRVVDAVILLGRLCASETARLRPVLPATNHR